jgi:RimJ/RimL family protein N-acetyltransferase
MFGNPIVIDLEGLKVVLRPPEQNEMAGLAQKFSSMIVQKFTNGTTAKTAADEAEWWEKIRKEPGSVGWAIVPEGSDCMVGMTALHDIHPYWGSCVSGIVIADPNFWGKGVAYRAHLARTWYAANTLNRMTIQSGVRAPNEGSLKALLKVGYRVSGVQDRNAFRDGRYIDSYVMSWVNPYHVGLLYPEGTPKKLAKSLKMAQAALGLADKCVKFL